MADDDLADVDWDNIDLIATKVRGGKITSFFIDSLQFSFSPTRHKHFLFAPLQAGQQKRSSQQGASGGGYGSTAKNPLSFHPRQGGPLAQSRGATLYAGQPQPRYGQGMGTGGFLKLPSLLSSCFG